MEGIEDDLMQSNAPQDSGTVALSIGSNSWSSLSRGFIVYCIVLCILPTDTLFFKPQKEATLASRQDRATYSGQTFLISLQQCFGFCW